MPESPGRRIGSSRRSALVDMDGDVHARNKVETFSVLKRDLDWDDLGDLLEVARAVALREQREFRGSAALDFANVPGELGIGIGVDGHVDFLTRMDVFDVSLVDAGGDEDPLEVVGDGEFGAGGVEHTRHALVHGPGGIIWG